MAEERPSPVALLLIDLVNPFDYAEGSQMLANTRAMLPAVQRLVRRSRQAGAAIIYSNDNFGRWRSSFADTVKHCRERGGDVIEALAPEEGDLFVLKPQRSGFYRTPLELLLRSLEVRTLVLAGIATEMCVLATAADAVEHGFSLYVPRDCTAACSDGRRDRALVVMQEGLGAETCRANDVPLERLMRREAFRRGGRP